MNDDLLKIIKQASDVPTGTCGYSSGSFFDCPKLTREALEDDVEKTALFLLPYLYRRFGPTWAGSDDDKMICRYYLTTEVDGLYLSVNCKAGNLYLCFSVGFTPQLRKNFPSNQDGTNKTVERCREALKETIIELTRPVYSRDIPFNIFGQCKDNYTLTHAEPSIYAGYGIPKEQMDKLITKNN